MAVVSIKIWSGCVMRSKWLGNAMLLFVLAAILLTVACSSKGEEGGNSATASPQAVAAATGKRTITDMAGRQVVIPDKLTKWFPETTWRGFCCTHLTATRWPVEMPRRLLRQKSNLFRKNIAVCLILASGTMVSLTGM